MNSHVTSVTDRLRITEVFYSLQGESSLVGLPTVFVRLTGCPLRCGYCDTAYAFQGGQWQDVSALLQQVAGFGTRYVTITGGEPLAQPACLALLSALCDQGYQVSLETSGALDICAVDSRVKRVMDLKTPGSGEMDKNRYGNIACLAAQDEVKFVITDAADYRWARDCLVKYQLPQRCTVLFSPAQGQLAPAELAQWILEDRLPVRFQIQLHKYLWGDVPGR